MLLTKPYDYQEEAIDLTQFFGGRALLGSEMGLGKTIQAIGWMDKYLKNEPGLVVVICQASLKWNWQNELKIHAGRTSTVLSGRKPNAKRLADGIYIINYEILGKDMNGDTWLRVLSDHRICLVIIDEVQRIQNPGTKQTKGTKLLCMDVPHVVGLSGTPFDNKVSGFFTILNILRPDIFPNREKFLFRYCNPQYKPWGWEFKGVSNGKELHKKLKDNVLIRYLKRDVWNQLPPIQRTIVPLKIVRSDEYEEADKRFLKWMEKRHPTRLSAAERNEKLTQMGYLLRLAAELKMDAALQWWKEFRYSLGPKAKAVLFANHHKILNILKEHLGKDCVVVTGKVQAHLRPALEKQFWGSVPNFLGQLDAANSGWNGQCASRVVFFEYSWNPAKHKQGEARCDRIGSTNRTNAYYLTAMDTIEQYIAQVSQNKQDHADEVLDGIERGKGDFRISDQVASLMLKDATKKKNKSLSRPTN